MTRDTLSTHSTLDVTPPCHFTPPYDTTLHSIHNVRPLHGTSLHFVSGPFTSPHAIPRPSMSLHFTSPHDMSRFHVGSHHNTSCQFNSIHFTTRHVTSLLHFIGCRVPYPFHIICHTNTCQVTSCHKMPCHVTSRHMTSCHVKLLRVTLN